MTAPTLSSTGTGSPAGDDWAELRAAALLGTDRRPLPPPSGDSPAAVLAAAIDRTDQATGLLELAALSTVRRRAGALPLLAPELPEPAPADPRPALPEAAARRLTVLLGGRTAAASVANLAELLPQWLAVARERGYRLPPELVPPLLDAARGRSELRADAVSLAGPLGRWLAVQNPDWRFVTRTATDLPPAASEHGSPGSGTPSTGDKPSPEGAEQLWHEGLFAERVTHLTRLRRSDPAAGLALLASTWQTERAEDRVLFLDALQDGLTAADEPFLEAALSDRSKNVRATAAELLSALPGSQLAARMAERARAAVRLHPDSDRLSVTPPTACDAAMQRDGIPPKSPTGRGERAWWFGEIVAAAPLTIWTENTGLTPDELLRLPAGQRDAGPCAGASTGTGPDTAGDPGGPRTGIASGPGAADAADEPEPEPEADWTDDLREAWARAAVRQQDAAWARALLGPPPRPGRPGRTPGAPAKLLSVLPAPERAAWTAAFVQTHGLGDAFQLLGACATPWTPPLSTAVVAALERAARSGAYPWSHSGVLGMTERALSPATAPAVEALAADAAPDTAWADTFNRLAGTLRFRAAMLTELAEPTEPAEPTE